MSDTMVSVVVTALERLMPKPESGNMAFVRCLPIELADAIVAARCRDGIAGWCVAVVSESGDQADGRIGAAEAVERREDKGDPTLLFIDPEPGAGLDGILSATTEIDEAHLFGEAVKEAQRRLPKDLKKFASKALSKAGWQKRRNPLAPSPALEYLCRACDDSTALGSILPVIGLWPVKIDALPEISALEQSALLAERLLPSQGKLAVPEQRVASLNLGEDQQTAAEALLAYLRSVDGLPRRQALDGLLEMPALWLNNLRLPPPGALQAIVLRPWRGHNGRALSGSGLRGDSGEQLEYRLSLVDGDGVTQRPLTLKWKVTPSTLLKGAITFQVDVVAAQDTLANKTVSANGKAEQKVSFSHEDFDEIDEHARFHAVIRVGVLGDSPCEPVETESFVLCFGNTAEGTTVAPPTRTAATMALAAADIAPDWESFRMLAQHPEDSKNFETAKHGYIICKWNGKIAKVFCPPLFRDLSDDWIERDGALGRWRLRVREDGTAVGQPEFLPMEAGAAGAALVKASSKLAAWLQPTQGPLGVLYLVDELPVVNGYVDAASRLWRTGEPPLTLIQTLEVQSLSGTCLGLIVLPTHPLRIAWQQGFDLMVAYHRYRADNAGKLTVKRLTELLRPVNGAHYPAFLPGIDPGQTFVFGDTLGLHAVAMVAADDPEPKATLALLGRLLDGDEETAPSVGAGAADALASELGRYLQLHPRYRRIRVHALRAGDAMPVTRALGQVQRALAAEEDVDATPDEHEHCFELDLFPGTGRSSAQSGRFLVAVAERRRSGAGAVPEVDRWLSQSVTRAGGVVLPRLRWARRDSVKPETPAHVAIAFDVFSSRVTYRQRSELPADGVLEAHGLMLIPSREFYTDGVPYWLSFVPPNPKGNPHPFTDKLTKRQVGLHAEVLRATARHLGGGDDAWPVLITEVGEDQAELLRDLHGLCDWVMTADRNAGLEYFDSPSALPEVYHAYIIDCVPERDDLGFMQLITSTASLDEVIALLDTALGEMGLSASPRNCRFLLDALKAVSGRLALRLAGEGTTTQEMIAIALVQDHCRRAEPANPVWPCLNSGFLVPVDDVPELFRSPKQSGSEGGERADLLYVSLGTPNGLGLDFIEVKFRRYLKTARAADLAAAMDRQLAASCQRWQQLFGPGTSSLEQTVNRAWLARILRFYARKALRHDLDRVVFGKLMHAIDALVRLDTDPPDQKEIGRLGFIFCPEYDGAQPTPIEQIGHADLWLFGAGSLTESRGTPEPGTGGMGSVDYSGTAVLRDRTSITHRADRSRRADQADGTVLLGTELSQAPAVTQATESADSVSGIPATSTLKETAVTSSIEPQATVSTQILLGHREQGGTPLHWQTRIDANPHLMILGLPGMGKTTGLINICVQLLRQGITPIVFSYHQDIDEKLAEWLAPPPLVVKYAGLGFNPMEVVGEGHLAYLDNAGMLRDIFAAIFPDLGDVQLGRLRDALKQSYLDCGWAPGQRGATPAFGTFLDLLRVDPKPDKGLLTRFDELDDYGLFGAGSGAPTLLHEQRPALIECHGTQNEYLQRAFATLVLHNLYQGMFRRGPQQRITHAVIFDEAHKAARLKLLGSMVKECRKYGIAFVVASQEAKDFDPSLFTAIANYLALRLNEVDAKLMAKSFASADHVKLVADRIKQMPKYQAMYYGEGLHAATRIRLLAQPPD